jgi:hypothetical protein
MLKIRGTTPPAESTTHGSPISFRFYSPHHRNPPTSTTASRWKHCNTGHPNDRGGAHSAAWMQACSASYRRKALDLLNIFRGMGNGVAAVGARGMEDVAVTARDVSLMAGLVLCFRDVSKRALCSVYCSFTLSSRSEWRESKTGRVH